MKSISPLTLLAIALACALPAYAATPPAPKLKQITSLDEVPEGLAKSDWSGVRAAYEAGRHAFQPVEGGWQARNPGQQWTTKFDRRGFLAQPRGADWQWGLELKSYGFPGAQRVVDGVPAVKAQGQRLSYDWDATVQEWFVNDQRGLEHGFTVNTRPEGAANAPLQFDLGVRGTLTPHLSTDALGVEFRNTDGATVLTYAGLKVWDAEGKVLSSRFVAVAEGVRLLVEERGARYPLTIDPLAQQAYLKPAAVGTTQAGDQFGQSVAVAGDTVVVGAHLEDSNSTGVNSTPNELATDAGAAYVFVRSAGVWTQQAYLKPAAVGTTQADDRFGYRVAISGDTVVVGAYLEDSNTTGVNSTPNEGASVAGAVYVFVRSAGVWTQQAYLKPAAYGTSQLTDRFGQSVAVAGDTLVVGAPLEDSSTVGVNSTANELATSAGAAYVFVRSAGVWTQQAYLKPAAFGTSQVGDSFGISVGVSGDTVIVGANAEKSSTVGVNSSANELASDAGAAYIFLRSGTTWTQQAYLKPAAFGTTQANDNFGISVAASGDRVVVGAYFEGSSTTGVNSTANEGAFPSGAAYVFARSSGVWTQEAYLKPAAFGTTQLSDNFGFSVAIAGDKVVVGAAAEDSGTTGSSSVPDEAASGAGAVYVFARNVGIWTQDAYLKPAAFGTTQAGDQFGHSVAISGDLVVAGASTEDSNTLGVNSTANEDGANSGAAYVFEVTTPEIAVEHPVGTDIADGGSKDVGTSPVNVAASAVTFTIKNTGLADLTLGAFTKDGANPSEFAVSTPTGNTVTAGSSVTFTVNFTPAAVGARSAVLHIPSNDSDEASFDMTLTGTGFLAPVVSATATSASITSTAATLGGEVTSDGGGGITERGIVYAATGTNNDPLIDGTGVTKVIASGTTGVFSVSASGLFPGTAYSFKAYATNSAGTTYSSVATFTTPTPEIAVFDGSGTGGAERTDNTGTHNFGSANLGVSSAPQTFTLQNTGAADLTGIVVTSTSALEFAIAGLGATTLAPGTTTTFTVTFAPGGAGARSGVINIASNDANENPFRINVSGTSVVVRHDWLWANGTSGTTGTINQAGVVLDAAGNSFVVGYIQSAATTFGPGITLTSSGSADIFLAKYDSSGTCLWARKMGGAGQEIAQGFDMDASGNFYITGYTQSSASFGNGITLTNAGAADAFVVKYNAAGTCLWARSIASTGSEAGMSIKVDASGNATASGYFSATTTFAPGITLTSAGGQDYYVARYDTNGTCLWATGAGGAGDDFARSLALDADGNTVVTGPFSGTATFAPGVTLTSVGQNDLFVAKYDGAGILLWSTKAGGTGNDTVVRIALDRLGNAFVAGDFSSSANFGPGITLTSAGGLDGFIAKYDTSGACLWAKSSGGATNSDNIANVALDAGGNATVMGRFYGTSTFAPGITLTSTGNSDTYSDNQLFVARYDSNGTCLWARSSRGTGINSGSGVAIDASGYAVVSGQFVGTNTFGPAFTLTNSGTLSGMFIARMGGPIPDIEVAQGAALSDGVSSVNFDLVNLGSSSAPRTFTITNPGTADLTSLAVTVTGADAAAFTVSALSSTSVAADTSTATFTVTFTPTTGGGTVHNAALAIASNVIGNTNPFNVSLTGTGIVVPSVASFTSTAITPVSATLGGDVTSSGGATITVRGVVYSITATNSNPLIGGAGVTSVTGAGTTGVFTVNATSLTANTAYSFKAYATNSAGTAYTSTGTFTTPPNTFDAPAGAPVTYATVIAGATTITKTGAGVLELTGLNTYTSTTNIRAGTISINTVNTGTNAQSLGAGTTVNLGLAATSSGTLLYTGGAGTLGKAINATGNGSDVIENGGSGLLTLSGTVNNTGGGLSLKGGASGITVSGVVTGAAGSSLAINGGTVTFTNANTYRGPLFIRNGGTMNANAANALPTANGRTNLTFDGTGTSVLNLNNVGQSVASLTSAGAATVNLNANTLTIGAASGSTTFAGSITGTGGLTKDGASTQILTGASNYSGPTAINAGTLVLAKNTSYASSTTTISAPGTLELTSTDTNVDNWLINSILAGSGTINKTGAGWIMTSTSAFTVSGTFNVQQGTFGTSFHNSDWTGVTADFNISSGALLDARGQAITVGSLNGAGNVGTTYHYPATVNVGAGDKSGSFAGVISGNGTSGINLPSNPNGSVMSVNKIGTGTQTLSGANTYTGATTISAGILQVDGSLAAGSTVGIGTAGTLSGSGTIGGNANVTGSGIINLADPGVIAGTLGVTGGSWNGAGSVTGAVTSSSGAFTIGNGANLTATSGLNVTGGTLASGSATSTITGSVNYTSASSSTFAGVIAGAGKTVTLNNAAATLTLSGANTFTGATTINAGVLQVDGSLAAGSTVGIGTAGTLRGSGTIGGNANVTGSGIINLTSPGVIAGSLGVTGGAWNGAGSVTGAVTSSSGVFTIGTGANLTATSGLNITGGTLASGSATSTITGSVNYSSAISSTFAGVITGAGKTVTLNNAAATLSLTGLNTYSDTTNAQAGTISINTVNTGTNAQSLGAGATVNLGVAGTSSATLLYTGGVGTLDKTINALGNGTDTIQNSGSGRLTLSGNLNKAGTTLTLKGGANGITVSGVITGNTGIHNSDLVINGGTVTLSNANTYDGPTFIRNSGTLNADVANALPTANGRTNLTFDGTGTSVLNLNNVGQAIASLTSTGVATVNLNANTLTIGAASGTTTFAGIINGTGGLTKDGASTQILTGQSTFTGNLTVSGGTLEIAGTGWTLQSANSATVSVASGATLKLSSTANNAVGYGVSSAEQWVVAGTITTTGGATQSFPIGGIALNGGTLTSTATLASHGAYYVNSQAGAVTANGTGNVINGIDVGIAGIATLTFTTPLTSDMLLVSASVKDVQGTGGKLSKTGLGTLTLSGANTYTGATTVSAGLLRVNGSLAAGSAVTVGSAGKLGGFGTINRNVTVAGALSPGETLGLLTIGGTTTLNSSAILEWELDTAQSNAETNRGVAYDGINTAAVMGSGAILKIILAGTQDFSDAFWDQNRSWTDILKNADGTASLTNWASVFSGGFQFNYNGKTVAPAGDGAFTLSGNTLTWTLANLAPVITSNGGGASASVNVAENTTAVTTVTATDASLPAQALTYSITGGADAAKFSIGSSSGVLNFVTGRNFESPTDVGVNNVYDVTVTVTDDNSPNANLSTSQALAVAVTNVNEAPTIIATNASVSGNEGTAITNSGTFSDPEGDLVVLTANVGTVTPQLPVDTTTGGRWRTSSVIKAQDGDGDNIYGTDGYGMWAMGGVITVVNPSYATIVRNPNLLYFGGHAGYLFIDDPANPAGAQKLTGVIYDTADPTTFCTITFSQARTVRMGVLVDNADVAAISPSTLRLQQTQGGNRDTGFLTAGTVATRNRSVDYYFFDITAQAGDVYVLSGNNDPAFYSNGIGGVFFDTGGPVPTSSGTWTWQYTPPDGPASSTVTVTGTDNAGTPLAGTANFALTTNNVTPTLAVTGNATVGAGAVYTLNLGAKTDPGTDTVTAYSINWGDGVTEPFTGNPASTSKTHTYTASGSKTIQVALTDEDGTYSNVGTAKSVNVTCPAIAVTNPVTTIGTTNTAFSQTFTQSGGSGAITFSTASTLPTGLTLSSAGVLSGIPTQAGTFPIVVTATDIYSCTGSGATYTLQIQSPNPNLANLTLSAGTLDPVFAAGTVSYAASVANTTTSITVTPTVAQAGATVTVNGATVASGSPSGSISLSLGTNVITTVVTALDGTTTKSYTVTVNQMVPDYTITTTGNAIVVTDVAGNGEALAIVEPIVGKIRFDAAGRSFGINGGTAVVGNSGDLSLSGITSITVNAGNGDDTVSSLGFTGSLPSLTINGDAGTDIVNLNGDIVFAANSNLAATAETANVSGGTDILTSGTGAITLTANTIDINATSTLVSASTVTLVQQTAARTVLIGTENASSLSLTDAELDRITSGTTVIGNSSSGAITISAAITHPNGLSLSGSASGISQSGGATLTLDAGKNLSVTTTGGMISMGQAITVSGTCSFTAGANEISVSSTSNNITGVLSISNSASSGVFIRNNASTGTTLGTVAMVGGGLGLNSPSGISQTGAITHGGTATFTVTGGSIILTNTGNNFSGVGLAHSGSGNVSVTDANGISIGGTVGSGELTVTTLAGILNTGALTLQGDATFISATSITRSGALFRSVAGAGTITYRANDSISGIGNITATTGSLNVIFNADRDANNSGSVTMGGAIATNGGSLTVGGGADPATTPAYNTSGGGSGVVISGTHSTSGGPISIRGHGGTNGQGISGPTFTLNAGGGSLTLHGRGGSSAATQQNGVRSEGGSGATLVSTGGSIAITGIAGANGTGTSGGVIFTEGSSITNTGTGGIAINGTATAVQTHACYFRGATVSVESGPLLLEGSGVSLISATPATQVLANGPGSITLLSAGDITMSGSSTAVGGGTATGPIALVGNNLGLTGGSIATTGTATLRPFTNGRGIRLGADNAAEMALTDAELDLVTAASVVIGDSNSGAITIDGNLSPANYRLLALTKDVTWSSGAFASDFGATAADYEKLSVAGTVTLTGASLSTAATGGFIPLLGETFTLLDNDGGDAINGTFASLPEGTKIVPFAGSTAVAGQISYVGGTGNDVVITGVVSSAEIAVEQPAGTDIADGATTTFPNGLLVNGTDTLTFTIKNTGGQDLTGLTITKDGAHQADFTVTASPTAPVVQGAGTTFTVQFRPSAVGTRTAALHIASNDDDENPFDINLSGTGDPNPDYTVTTVAGLLTITNNTNSSDTLTISQPSDNHISFAVATRNFRVNDASNIVGSSGDISLTGITSVVVNAQGGNDIINLDPFSGTFPAGLTINGGAGNDTITMGGDMTFAADASLDIDLQNDDATPGNDAIGISSNCNYIVSGTGAITLRVSRSVTMASSSSLEAVNGNIIVEANQQAVSPAVQFLGITVNTANIITSGSGNITLNGRGNGVADGRFGVWNGGSIYATGTGSISITGTTAATSGANQIGVVLDGAGVDVTTASGNITITGTGGLSTGGGNHGVIIRGAAQVVTTTSGTIAITGTGGGTGASSNNDGVRVENDGDILAQGTGSIILNGTAGTGTTPVGINIANFTTAATVVSNNQPITFIADKIAIATGAPLPIISAGTSTLTLRQKTNGVAIDVGSTVNTTASTLELSDAELDRITAGTLAIGNADSGAVKVSDAISRSASTVLNLTSAANIDINGGSAQLNSANGDITLSPGTHIFASHSGVDINAGTGTVTLPNSADLRVQIGGTTVDTQYVQLNVQGEIDLTDADLVLVPGAGYVPAAGNSYVIVNNDGTDAITGTFNGLSEGDIIPSFLGSTLLATITYEGGVNGNDVVLTAFAPVEIAVEQPAGTDIADGGSRAFGSVEIGTSSDLVFTISNSGSSDLTGVAVTVDGTNAADFTVTASPTLSVGANDSTTFTVTFAPSATGARSAALHIASNDGDENPFDITLTGTGITPEIVVEQPVGTNIATGGTKSFGGVNVGVTSSLTFTIGNTGTSDLTDLTITKDGLNEDEFVITANPVAPVAGPAGTTTFTIEFTPTGIGARTALISIANNDLDEDPFEINLTGNGLSPEIVVEQPVGTNIASGDTKDFGVVNVNASSSLVFTIKNVGNSDLTNLAITKSGADQALFQITANAVTPVSGPTGSTTFTVQFTPTSRGIKTATLQIANNDLDEDPFEIDLTGTGGAYAAALAFDGVDDAVEIAPHADFNTPTFTVEGWVKPTAGMPQWSRFWGTQDNRGDLIVRYGSDNRFVFAPVIDGAYALVFAPTTWVSGQWYHVAGVVDHKSVRLFINGVEVSSRAKTSAWTGDAGVRYIGKSTSPSRFEGAVDEVRYWNHARNCDQIEQAYDGELTGSEPGLVAYYKFNQGLADADNTLITTATDSSGHGHTGTLQNFDLTDGNIASNWVTPGAIASGILAAVPQFAEIDVNGNSAAIYAGDTAPSDANHTDFGDPSVEVTRTFTISNPGNLDLTIEDIVLTGADAAAFELGGFSPDTVVAGGSSTTFTVTAETSTVDAHLATITITSDDCDEGSFDFVIQSAPPIVISTTGGIIAVNDPTAATGTLEIKEDSPGFIKFTSATRSFSVGAGYDVFGESAPIDLSGISSIMIAGSRSSETVNVGAFTTALPGLTINGTSGNDVVNFTDDLTFAAGKSLTVNLTGAGASTINVATNANLVTSGTGSITLNTTQNVAFAVGASLVVANGNVSIAANQQGTPTVGNFSGVTLSGALIEATGTGAVTIAGKGGNYSSGAQAGVRILAGGDVLTATGLLTVQGAGGASAGAGNYGVQINGAGSSVISGSAQTSIIGIEGTGPSGIAIVGQASAAITNTASGGSVTLDGNSVLFDTTINVTAQTSGSVTVKPFSDGVGISLGLGTNIIGGSLSLTDAELDRITAGTINIGGSTSGSIIQSASINRAVATHLVLTTSGDIAINAGTMNSGGGNITLTSAGVVTAAGAVLDINAGTNGIVSIGGSGKIGFAINSAAINSGYQQLNVAGLVDLTGTTLNLSGTHMLLQGQSLVLINNDGTDSVQGAFAGLPEGSTLLFNAVPVAISYIGGTGNDVTLAYATPTLTAAKASVAGNEGSTVTNTGAVIDLQGNVTLTASHGAVTNLGNGTWSWTYVPNDGPEASGNVTITATDASTPPLTSSITFSLSVTNVAPVAQVHTQTILEDALATPITLPAIDPGLDTLTYAIVMPPVATKGTLGAVTGNVVNFTPATNFVGQATFTFKVTDSDNAVSNTATVTINVDAVNDAPTFTLASTTRTHAAGFTTAQTVASWASAVNDGDPEATQPLTFTVTQTAGPAIFTTAPAINSAGTLTYRTNGTAGAAIFSVVLKDNGLTANGGFDTSTVRSFTINVGVDTTIPTVTITAPAAAAKVPEGTVNVTGTAADNKRVQKVEVQLNNGAFVNATTTVAASGLTATYTASISPLPGLNTLAVRSTDTANNISVVVTRTFTYVVMRTFAAAITPVGSGTVAYSPALVGGKAQLGTTYTLTATANSGYFFDFWNGSGVAAAPVATAALTFEMTQAIATTTGAITANFLASPFEAGNYTGLAQADEDTTPSQDNLGLFSGALTIAGKLTTQLNFAGTTSSLIATFDPHTGDATGATAAFEYELHLDINGATDKITGTVTDIASGDVSEVDADRATFGASNKVPDRFLKPGDNTKNGIYTVVFPALPSQAGLTTSGYPQGDGIGTLTVTPLGVVSLAGTLADGTAVTASAPISKTFAWPMAIIIKGTATVSGTTLAGMVQFDTLAANSDVSAEELQWFRSAKAGSAYYPAGWPGGIQTYLTGAKFVTPVGSSVLPGLGATNSSGNAKLEFSDGLQPSTITKHLNISAANAVTKIPTTDASYTLTITGTTGALGGSFAHPGHATLKPAIKGIVLQKGANSGGYGFFLSPSTGESGGITLSAK